MLAPSIQIERAIPGFDFDLNGKPLVPTDAKSLYSFGHLIRTFESEILTLFSRGLLSGTTHTCIGQEICQISVVRALDHPDDAVLSTHRNHGHFLTYSGDFIGLLGEVMGRECGVCGGIGGSQHLAYRHFHSNGVQGGMTAIATGLAFGRKRRNSRGIVTCFIGDGTLGQGLVYESLNLSSVWQVPVLFVVEANGIAQTTEIAQTLGGSIAARGAAFGLRTWCLDDSDPDICERTADVVRAVRSTSTPGFLIVNTRRLGPHSKGDDLRDQSEMQGIRERDPLTRLGLTLDPNERRTCEARNAAFVASLVELATESPVASSPAPPVPRFNRLRSFAPGDCETSRSTTTVRASLNDALSRLLADDRRILLGEDLHDPYGGAFKVTAGLSTAYPDRVLSTPISEAGVVGAAIGLAGDGFRPIVEVMFADFITLAFDQIYNHAVKFPGMFEHADIPLVIRTPAGGRRGYGPTHSQNPESLACAVPGLIVVFPSHRHRSGQLLSIASNQCNSPVLFLEHKLLYGEREDSADYVPLDPAPEDRGAELFPTLVRPRENPDLTLVTYGGMLPTVEAVADALEAEELSVEIVVPSLLQPLPRRTLVERLMACSQIAIVEEAPRGPGPGSELASFLCESRYRGRIRRFAPEPVPIPAARSLESEVLITERSLKEQLVSYVLSTGD